MEIESRLLYLAYILVYGFAEFHNSYLKLFAPIVYFNISLEGKLTLTYISSQLGSLVSIINDRRRSPSLKHWALPEHKKPKHTIFIIEAKCYFQYVLV